MRELEGDNLGISGSECHFAKNARGTALLLAVVFVLNCAVRDFIPESTELERDNTGNSGSECDWDVSIMFFVIPNDDE